MKKGHLFSRYTWFSLGCCLLVNTGCKSPLEETFGFRAKTPEQPMIALPDQVQAAKSDAITPSAAPTKDTVGKLPPPEMVVPAQKEQVNFVAGAERPDQAARVSVAWNNKVIYAPDPTRGGEDQPGLLARVYVFGVDETAPLRGNGSFVIDLFDQSPKGGSSARLLEQWRIDAATASRFLRRDLIGEGYTLFLPWSTYHVDITRVNMIVRYTDLENRSLLAQPEVLNIDHSATLQKAAEKLGKKIPVE
ncbi:MAG: hypothetical protein R3B84_21500 [Zavarzinella sp.]